MHVGLNAWMQTRSLKMIARQTKLADTDELYHKQTALCCLIVFFITLSCDRDPQLQVAEWLVCSINTYFFKSYN